MKREIYQFDAFQLDAGNRQLRREGKPVPLPAKAFDLLQTLLENRGRLVSKNELFSSVWHDQFVEEANLTVNISAIRKVLGENKNNPRFIETVPGYGYRFVGEVSNLNGEEFIIETETISRVTIEREIDEEKRNERVERKTLSSKNFSSPFPLFSFSKKAVGGIILLFLVIGGFWFFNRMPENRGGNVPVAAAEKQPRIKRLTSKGRVNIAVLSPDGKFFAYSFYELGSFRSELRLGQTDGSSDVALLPLADTVYNPFFFSRDGSWLYYMQRESRSLVGTLYKIPVLPGGVPQKITGNVSIYTAVSPDEKQIAFVRNSRENKTSALVVANLDGSAEREIAVRPF